MVAKACSRSRKSPGNRVRMCWWPKAAVVVPLRRDGERADLHMSRNFERSLRGYEAEESKALQMLGSRTRANSLCMDPALRLGVVGFDGIVMINC